MENKNLYLIRGLSGSGKTTLALELAKGLEDVSVISVDDYFEDENGNYSFDGDLLQEAHHWCIQNVSDWMSSSAENIIVHNTLTRKWEVDPYLELASIYKYRHTILSLYDGGLSDIQLTARSKHNTPLYAIKAQRKRWENDVFRDKAHTSPKPYSKKNHKKY